MLDRLDFVQADITKRLPFETGNFVFVHGRSLDTFLSESNWPQVIRELNRVTKPDGWVEIFAGGTFFTEQPSPICTTLVQAAIKLCLAINIAPTGGPGMGRYLQEAGIYQHQKRQQLMPNPKAPQDKIRRTRELVVERPEACPC